MKTYKFITSNGNAIQIDNVIAKSKLEALKIANIEYIYWKGNTPYGATSSFNMKSIFAIIEK